jgi:hypothetical protein
MRYNATSAPPLDIYKSVETAAPAIAAIESLEHGFAVNKIPDFRPNAERAAGQEPRHAGSLIRFSPLQSYEKAIYCDRMITCLRLSKICGTTSVEDAKWRNVPALITSALSLSMQPSPRNVSVMRAKEIAAAVETPVVAVTVNLSLERLLQINEELRPAASAATRR